MAAFNWRQYIDRTGPRRLAPGRFLPPSLPSLPLCAEGNLAVGAEADLPGNDHQIAGAHEGHVIGDGRRCGGECDASLGQACLRRCSWGPPLFVVSVQQRLSPIMGPGTRERLKALPVGAVAAIALHMRHCSPKVRAAA